MRRLADWALRLPPRMQDLALALALAAYYVGSLIPVTSQLNLPVAAFVLVVLQALPLTWRRRWPVPVLFAVGIPSQIYAILGIPYGDVPFGPMIAYYTVMDRSSTRTRWAISLLVVFGLIRVQFLPYHTAYSLFTGLLEFGVAGIAGVFSRTHRAYTREVEARAEQAETERERQVALAAAQERTRIARELHDVVAHHVSLMAVQSEAAASLLPDRPVEAGKSVQIIGDTAREALTELRRLLGVLRDPAEPGTARQPATAPAPSIGELDEVLVQVRQAGIAVNLRVEGNPSKLAPGVDLAAYRIVQEALTNTVRHSGASTAAVTVSYEPGYVTVSVTDTGHGPIAVTVGQQVEQASVASQTGTNGASVGKATVTASGGFGLAGIAERVASCGGSLTVGPGRAGGFAVTAKLPTP